MRKTTGLIIGALTTLTVFAWPVQAQDYPSQPVRIVVPFAAGGASDIMARIVADKLQTAYGSPFIVENRTGAGGTIGAEYVVNADPDGYTLLLGTTATQSISPAIYPDLAYSPVDDLAAISLLSTIPMVLVVNPSVPASTIPEFIAYSRDNPGDVEFGSSGNGSITHLASELFAFTAEIDLLHIPYSGSAPAITDLMGGEVKMMIDHTPTVLQHIRAGTLNALGIASAERLEDLPDVPTIEEQGIPYSVSSWVGLLAPKDTPPEIIESLNASLNEILNDENTREQLAVHGTQAAPTTAAEFEQIMRSDLAQWTDVVERASIE